MFEIKQKLGNSKTEQNLSITYFPSQQAVIIFIFLSSNLNEVDKNLIKLNRILI